MKYILLLLSTFLLFGFTAFDPLPINPGTLTQQGEILTHDGAADVVFPACDNGEILEWDSGISPGVKCVTKPVSAGSENVVTGASSGAPTTACDIPAVTITTTGGSVMVIASPADDSPVGSGGGYGGSIYSGSPTFVKDGTIIQHSNFVGGAIPTFTFIDVAPAAGTYTYDVMGGQSFVGGPPTNNFSCQFMKLTAVEIK